MPAYDTASTHVFLLRLFLYHQGLLSAFVHEANPTPRKTFDEVDIARLTAQMFNSLTTPHSTTEQIALFASKHGANTPVYLECQPELWSRQRLCNMNVEKYI